MGRRVGLVLLVVVLAVGAGWLALRSLAQPVHPGATATAVGDSGSATPSTDPVPTGSAAAPSTEPTTSDSSSAGCDEANPCQDPVPTVRAGTAVVTVATSGWDAAGAQVRVSAYVDGIEATGTCVLTLRQGDRTATTQVDAVPNASTMSCGTMTVPGSQLGKGTWQAVVKYTSTSRSGSAADVTITIP
jgi:hypothetical protein